LQRGQGINGWFKKNHKSPYSKAKKQTEPEGRLDRNIKSLAEEDKQVFYSHCITWRLGF